MLIPTGICHAVSILSFFLFAIFPVGLIAALFVLSLVAFIVLSIIFFIKLIANSKRRKKILRTLPPELLPFKKVYDQNEIELKKVEASKAAFIKKNIKK